MDQDAKKADLVEDLAIAAENLCRSTVQVRGRSSGHGSGVIWRSNGLVITNAHVVRGPRATIKLADERELDAVVIARDRRSDLAALQVEASDLPSITVSSEVLRVGELVLAVGNPLGLVGVLTTGVIHAISHNNVAGGQWIQADVRLAPGNSGGPLANSQGHVIGINCMIVGSLALAIPSHTVEQFLQQGARSYLGVTTQPVLVPLGGKRVVGLLVIQVAAESAAEQHGLLIGDVLTTANGQPFNSPDDLLRAILSIAGSALQLDLLRGGKPMSYRITVCSSAG